MDNHENYKVEDDPLYGEYPDWLLRKYPPYEFGEKKTVLVEIPSREEYLRLKRAEGDRTHREFLLECIEEDEKT